MLVRLLPQQVNSWWEKLRPVLEKEVGFLNGEATDLLEAIYKERLIVWLSGREKGAINGFMLTSFAEDGIINRKSLVVYLIHRLGNVTRDDWMEGIKALKKYAKASGCTKVIGYTKDETVVKLARFLGGKVSSLLEFDVDYE
jgi:hypothetical protein